MGHQEDMPPLALVETNILPTPKLLVVFSGLAFALLVSFIDQTSLGIALPIIGEDLNATTTIGWAGTSSMIANTIFAVLYGRLSDILGRKLVFLTAVALLVVGDLASSFAQTGPQLYVFRGIAGIGNGGITSLSIMIVSDVVTLERRGKFQGIIGSCVGLGNAIGPFLAAAIISKTTWRALYWIISPLAALSGLLVAWVLPPSKMSGQIKDKLRMIDYLGTVTSSISLLLILIPISGGGTYFAWSSKMVISMLTLGCLSFIAFLVVEWKIAKMPMMPLRLFRSLPITAIVMQSFLLGIVYFSHFYFLPIYYQSVRGYSPLKAASLSLPFVAAQSVFSILGGQYISRVKRYGEVIWLGFGAWALGCSLLSLFNRTIQPYAMVLILICEGLGVGWTFQPTIIAAQAHSPKADRAVVISIRNFTRALGGSFGLAISSAIFSNVLNASTKTLPQAVQDQIRETNLGIPDLSRYSNQEAEIILEAYAKACHTTFIAWAPFMAACFILCSLIKDRGLQRKEEKMAEAASSAEDSMDDVSQEVGTQENRMEKGLDTTRTR